MPRGACSATVFCRGRRCADALRRVESSTHLEATLLPHCLQRQGSVGHPRAASCVRPELGVGALVSGHLFGMCPLQTTRPRIATGACASGCSSAARAGRRIPRRCCRGSRSHVGAEASALSPRGYSGRPDALPWLAAGKVGPELAPHHRVGPDPHLGEPTHPVPLLLTSLSAPSPHAGTPARMRCRWQRRGRGPAPVAGRPQSADSAREAAAAASLEAEPALGCERRQDAGSGRVRSTIRDPRPPPRARSPLHPHTSMGGASLCRGVGSDSAPGFECDLGRFRFSLPRLQATVVL